MLFSINSEFKFDNVIDDPQAIIMSQQNNGIKTPQTKNGFAYLKTEALGSKESYKVDHVSSSHLSNSVVIMID